jgi:arylsulfatase A-like enzyme
MMAVLLDRASRSGLAACLVLVCGCGRNGVEPVRVRLTELASELEARPVPPAEVVLREGFDALAPEWRVGTDRENPMVLDAAALVQALEREGERGFLRLSGTRGALYRVLPVEPDTPYLFSGTLRARGLEPAVAGPCFWLGELSARGAPEELFGAGRSPLVRAHPLAPARSGDWEERTLPFRTAPTTRALLVMCQLWVPNREKGEPDLVLGTADFDALALARIDERELWELTAARAVAAAHRGAVLPPDGDARARRRVDALLAAEQRPALLCLPGERLRIRLRVPRADPVFECGLALWPAAFRANAEDTTWRVVVEGREVSGTVKGCASLAEAGWVELTTELTAFAGREMTLELAVDGALPLVFGAPAVRARAAEPLGWNVLFVSIDTLRADRVGAYGATSGATPHLDALAARGILFEDVTANAPYTLPAHATLFTGQFPSVHAVEDAGRPLAPARSPVLAAELAARGWRTQAFTAAGFLVPDFGFHAGFDGFSIRDPLRHPGSRFFADFAALYPEQGPAPAGPGTARVRQWIRAHAAEPFFLFVHTYEVHDYDPPPGTLDCVARGCRSTLEDVYPLTLKRTNAAPFPGTPEDRAHVEHRYEAALRHVDAELGELLDELEESGIAERTLVVVTSDHGEEFFERGFLQHGKSLHREVLAIPLVLAVPGRAPARRGEPVMQVDVAPTVLAALGLPIDARMQGRDLLARTLPALPIWAEVDDLRARQLSLRADDWKVVYGPPDAPVFFPRARAWSLYDLTRDREEREDLAEREPERLGRLRRRLEAVQAELEAAGERLGPPPSGEVDEATQALLKNLGYGE